MPVDLDVRSIFASAVDLPPKERGPYLDGACGRDVELRRNIESLLEAHDKTNSFHERDSAGTLIGPYKLLQRIGEGGFGVVYMAEQQRPVVRKVALKIIKLGMDTQQVIARFEAERQALAMMDHAHIARVFDAGATETGRPYFVMELVHGIPITKFCDENRLTIEDRLKLFQQVCNAVQHAHTKGIIHRDIKPSNVLVTMHDDKPVPKVIDFGISKATNARLTDKTLFTEYGKFIGTPAYMSPEQAQMSGLDIDTRSDIYSLGVLLYELLTGMTPFDAQQLVSIGLNEMQRMIREVEPPRPSTRVEASSKNQRATQPKATTPQRGALDVNEGDDSNDATLEDPSSLSRSANRSSSLDDIAKFRRVEASALPRRLRGDLDWIVMKALEKARTRRYETANGLGLDIARYLTGEPVVAAPPSKAYRLRKFVRRNKGPVWAGAAIAATLVLGIVGTGVGLYRAEHQKVVAERQRDKAELISDFMVITLKSVGPNVSLGRDTTLLAEMMDAAAAKIDRGELAHSPEAEFRLRMTIGHVYRQIARFDDAERLLIPAFEFAKKTHSTDHSDQAWAANYLGVLRLDQGRATEALPLFQSSLEMWQRLHAGDHDNVAELLTNFASALNATGKSEQSLAYYQQAMEMRIRMHPGDDVQVANAIGNMGFVLHELGRPRDAEPFDRRSLEMRRRLFEGDHPDIANSLNNLASAMGHIGDRSQATELFRESLEMQSRLFKADHPLLAQANLNLGESFLKQGLIREADGFFQEALEIRRRVFRGDHPHLALSLMGMGLVRRSAGRDAEAKPYYEEALAMRRRLFKGDHTDVASSLDGLAMCLHALGRHAEANILSTESLQMSRRLYTEDHLTTALRIHNLSQAKFGLGLFEESESLQQEALAIYRRLVPGDHRDIAKGLGNLAAIRRRQGRVNEMESLCRESLDMMKRLFPYDHPDVADAHEQLGIAYMDQNRLSESEPLLRVASDMRMRLFANTDNENVIRGLINLSGLLAHLNRLNEADQLSSRALEMSQRLFKSNDARLAKSLESRATTRWQLKDLAGAESLFRETYDCFSKAHSPSHSESAGALRRVAVVLAEQSRHEEAEALMRDLLEQAQSTDPPDPIRTSGCEMYLGRLLLDQGRHSEAEPLLKAAFDKRNHFFPAEHPQSWRAATAQSHLGEAIAQQKRFAEAEPLLLVSAEKLLGNPMVPPPRTTDFFDLKREAVDRVIQLYDDWHQAEPDKAYAVKAAEWRAKLEKRYTTAESKVAATQAAKSNPENHSDAD